MHVALTNDMKNNLSCIHIHIANDYHLWKLYQSRSTYNFKQVSLTMYCHDFQLGALFQNQKLKLKSNTLIFIVDIHYCWDHQRFYF